LTLTDSPLPLVSDEQIADIARDVWQSFLGMDLEPAALVEHPLDGPTVTGCVHVSGEWNGSVVLESTAALAQAAAEAMFAAEPGSLSAEEVSDALGELTNMVGGNIKSLLPAPSKLSIPSVTEGISLTVRVPGAVLLDRVALVCDAGPLLISIWKV
jgi:chemotaxis protein CheX